MSESQDSSFDPAASFQQPAQNEQYTAFFQLWDPVIAQTCTFIHLSEPDRDEILNNVRVRIWMALELRKLSFPTNAEFATFVRRTTRGLCLNFVNRRKIAAPLPDNLTANVEQISWLEDYYPFLPADRSSQEQVEWLFAQMPTAHREILILKLIEGLTFSEIAKRLGCGVTTAHDRYMRAYFNLRQRFLKS